MSNIGFPEILVVLVFALVIFGPARLPEIARSLGSAVAEFRRVTRGLQEELHGELEDKNDSGRPPGA